MARYFFDRSVGATLTKDEHGAVCANDQSAVQHAWTALPQVISEATLMLPWQRFELAVRREDGLQVGRVSLTVVVETANPATIKALTLGRVADRPQARSQ